MALLPYTTGEEEAKAGGKLLKEEGIKFDRAYTSYLRRAIKTCWLVLEQVGQHHPHPRHQPYTAHTHALCSSGWARQIVMMGRPLLPLFNLYPCLRLVATHHRWSRCTSPSHPPGS